MADDKNKGSASRRTGAGIGAAVRDAGAAAAGSFWRHLTKADPLTGPLINAAGTLVGTQGGRVMTRDFLEGAVSGNPNKPAPRVAPKAAAVINPVEAALAQGKAGPQPSITPQDRQLAFLDAVFRKPLTLEQASLASGMLPTTGKPPTAKDTLQGQAALLSQQIFDHQLALAQGDDTKTAAAMEAEYQRRIGIIGVNPLNVAMANNASGEPD